MQVLVLCRTIGVRQKCVELQTLTNSTHDLVVATAVVMVLLLVLVLAVKVLQCASCCCIVEHDRYLRWRGRGGLAWIVSKTIRWQNSRASALMDKFRRPCGEHVPWLAIHIPNMYSRFRRMFVYSVVAYIVSCCSLHTMATT